MIASPFLSNGLADAAVWILSGGLGHTSTRTPVTYSSRDRWSQKSGTPGDPTEGVRCRYLSRTHIRQTDGGFVVATAPPIDGGTLAFLTTLTILPGDPLAPGDLVSNVRDRLGAVLLAGPATVRAVLDHAGFGETTLRMVVLEGVPVEDGGA